MIIKKLFLKIFGHQCEFDTADILLCSYKDSYGRIISSQMNHPPFGWDIVKDIQPKCVHCGKMTLPDEFK
jgi:hypothetical protein